MYCPHCGSPNKHDACFCSTCGKVIGGRPCCPTCWRQNSPDSVFCRYCGTKLAANNVPVVIVQTVPAPAAPVRTDDKPHTDRRKIVSVLGSAAAMIAVLFSLLFVFLTGLSMHGSSGYTGSLNIWYFFGKGYRETAEYLGGLSAQTDFTTANLYIPIVFGTLLMSAMLLSVITLAICATVRYIRNLLGKTEKKADKLACMTYFVFLAGCLLLKALEGISNTETALGITVTNYACDFNAATMAGLTFGGLFVLGYFICTMIVKYEKFSPSLLVKDIFALGGIVFVVILLSVAGCMGSGISQVLPDSLIKTTYHVRGGPLRFLYMLGTRFENQMYDIPQGAFLAQILLIVSSILQIAVFALAVYMLSAFMSALEDKPRRRGLVGAIVLYAVSCVSLAIGVLGVDAFVPYITEGMEGIGNLYTPFIAACVFSFFALAAAITQTVVWRVREKKNAEEIPAKDEKRLTTEQF